MPDFHISGKKRKIAIILKSVKKHVDRFMSNSEKTLHAQIT